MNIKPEPRYHTQTALTKTIIIKTTMKTKQLVANTTTSTTMTKTKNIIIIHRRTPIQQNDQPHTKPIKQKSSTTKEN